MIPPGATLFRVPFFSSSHQKVGNRVPKLVCGVIDCKRHLFALLRNDLHDADAELLEELKVTDLVLAARCRRC